MSNIKLVLTDIDGTIVRHGQHNPSSVVRQAIIDVQDSGIKITAATGRPYEMTRDLFLDIGLDGLSVFDNGASVRDIKSGELFWNNWLSIDRIKAISSILLPHSRIIDFFPTYKELPARDVTIDNVVEPAPYVFALVSADSIQAINTDLEVLPDLTVNIDLAHEDSLGMMSVQVTDIGSNKYHAIETLRGLLHSNKAETLAIGDSHNDIPLFMNAGIKVAMGNAVEELKTQADHVVGTIQEDGFAEAMQKFVLT